MVYSNFFVVLSRSSMSYIVNQIKLTEVTATVQLIYLTYFFSVAYHYTTLSKELPS